MVSLVPIGPGEEFIFENIFFDLDKDDLKQESASSLKRLYNFLMEGKKLSNSKSILLLISKTSYARLPQVLDISPTIDSTLDV